MEENKISSCGSRYRSRFLFMEENKILFLFSSESIGVPMGESKISGSRSIVPME